MLDEVKNAIINTLTHMDSEVFTLQVLLIATLVVFAMYTFMRNKSTLQDFFLLKNEVSNSDLMNIYNKIDTLEEIIKKSDNKKRKIHESNDSLDTEIKEYIDKNLENILKPKIEESKDIIYSPVVNELKASISETTTNFLTNKSEDELSELFVKNQYYKNQKIAYDKLSDMLENETISASRLKQVMINLFVVASFLFILFNIFIQQFFNITNEVLLEIVLLYFSLGSFIIYIIRTSHSRTLTLLAIREQNVNYMNTMEYLKIITKKNTITEHDVEIVRMLLTNRAERESKIDHPYEVIIKGVSGSNIQFKGGKMSLGNADKIDKK